MEVVPTVGSDVVTPAARAPMRDAPPRGLPVGGLRLMWLHCAKPVTTVTADHLQLDDVKNRVNVSVLLETEHCGHGNDSALKWSQGALMRFTEVHKGYYFIPTSIKCDRTLFERPGDAIYIERMWLYIHNDSESLPPICTGARLYEVVVTEDKAKIQQHQLMWAVLIVHGRVMTFENFFVAIRLMTDLSCCECLGSRSPALPSMVILSKVLKSLVDIMYSLVQFWSISGVLSAGHFGVLLAVQKNSKNTPKTGICAPSDRC